MGRDMPTSLSWRVKRHPWQQGKATVVLWASGAVRWVLVLARVRFQDQFGDPNAAVGACRCGTCFSLALVLSV